MLDEKVRKIVEGRLKSSETILWAESADAKVRAESEGITTQDTIWQYVGAIFFLGLFSYYGYESLQEETYIRLCFVLLCLAGTIYAILFSRGILPNPFIKNNVGEQFDHYVITNQRLRLFQKNINKGPDFPIATIDHAFIQYPKKENFLTISFLDDPDEDRMLSLNGVVDFSEAVKIINELVGHPRKKKKRSKDKS